MLLVTPFPNLPVLARQHDPWPLARFLRDGFRADKVLATRWAGFCRLAHAK
jgi:hypothetical protein